MNTRVSYMYRDASNWKFFGSFFVEGNLKRSDLECYLLDGEWFDPVKIGLPHLLTLPINEDDHCLHELTQIDSVDTIVEPIGKPKLFCSSSELISKFCEMGNVAWQ